MTSKELDEFVSVIIGETGIRPSVWYMYNSPYLIALKYESTDDRDRVLSLMDGWAFSLWANTIVINKDRFEKR